MLQQAEMAPFKYQFPVWIFSVGIQKRHLFVILKKFDGVTES